MEGGAKVSTLERFAAVFPLAVWLLKPGPKRDGRGL